MSNRLKSTAVNVRTELVNRAVTRSGGTYTGCNAGFVCVKRCESGVNIVFKSAGVARNNGTLGFCTRLILRAAEDAAGSGSVGSNSRGVNGGRGIGMLGGGMNPPFGRTRCCVVCNRNVSGCRRLVELTRRCNMNGGCKRSFACGRMGVGVRSFVRGLGGDRSLFRRVERGVLSVTLTGWGGGPLKGGLENFFCGAVGRFGG